MSSDPERVLERDWILWRGGECPVAEGTEVEIWLRGRGKLGRSYLAENLVWGRWVEARRDRDIIAYRIVTPVTRNV